MTTVNFPSSLPRPSFAPVQLAERRLLSDIEGPQQARGIQRDYLATQQLEWDLLDTAAAAAFQHWWQFTIVFGLAWFSATWPFPSGCNAVVRRFIGPPKWQYLPGGFWRVSAACEVRGRGLLPVYPTYDIDLDSLTNAGPTESVGKTIAGLDPDATYVVTLPPGRLYTAWSDNASLGHYTTQFYTKAGAVTIPNGNAGYFSSAAAAYAAYPGGSIMGASAYTFWLPDTYPPDNDGGMSLSISQA